MTKYFLLFYISFSFEIFAQKIAFSNYVDTLCSNYFKGRGYVDNGHLKAANFLANEYKNLGLKSLNTNGYFQKFNINVNTFPNKISLKIEGISLIPGEEFMIEPYSKAIKGVYSLARVDLKNWKSYLNNKNNSEKLFLSLDVRNIFNKDTLYLYSEIKNILNNQYPILWVNSKKLQWSIADYVSPYPVINVQDNPKLGLLTQIEINCKNQFLKALQTQNVIGSIIGKRKKTIIISAHYDHLGMMGDVKFPGANDNASGVSLLLNLARYYSQNKPKNNMIFICFGAEEAGLKGSKYFTDYPPLKLKKVKLLINLDIVGTGEEGIAIVNAFEQKKATTLIGKINSKQNIFDRIKLRGQAPNSDHFWFSKQKVPSIFIYTMGGIKAYHDPWDKHETLPLNKIEDLQNLVIEFLQKF